MAQYPQLVYDIYVTIWSAKRILCDDFSNRLWPFLTLVGQHPMKSLLFVCPSVCPSLTFLKIGSLVFSDIVHDDSWPWHLVTDEPDLCKKKIGSLNWVKWAKIRRKTRGLFCHFLQFGVLVFLEIGYSDSLQQCITSSRGKTHEKSFFGTNFGSKQAKTRSKISFFWFIQVGAYVFL